MPRIAFVLKAFYGDHIGGAERQVQILSQALRQEGWETTYICERDSGKPRRESLDGMDILALPVRKMRSSWLNYRALRRAMESSGADLFYQRVRLPYTGLAAYIARRLKKPFVYAAASLADVIRKEDLRYSTQTRSPVNALLHPLNRTIEDWGILHADALILQTEEQLHLLKLNYNRSGTVVPNHIVIANETSHPKQSPPEVLWISNIKPFKRPELFLELSQRCHDVNAQFVMAGSCPNVSIFKNIRDTEEKLPNFSYIGPLAPIESEKRIAAAALLVCTSEFEGFPNAFQQAWANAVPTLSLDVDPDGVIAREGLGGCVKSLDELEQILRRLLKDEVERKEIGGRAQSFARRTYDLELLLPRYLSLFETLLRT